MSNEAFFEFFIEAAVKSYISVMGADKWNSLTDEERHDAVMMIANGMKTALENK
jgi:hypothetical protein